MRNCIWILLTIVVTGCNVSNRPNINQLSEVETSINSLKRYYPDSLELDLVREISLISGNYYFNSGFYMRFLQLDSTSIYKASEWSDTSGNSQKVAGEWKIKDATIFLLNNYREEAFDVIGYKGSIFLVPIEERDKLANLIIEVSKYETLLKSKANMADNEEDQWTKLLEINYIFIKNK